MDSAFGTPFSGIYLPDQDGTVILGRTRLFNVATDYASFAHYDNATANNYALWQAAAGGTSVNSKEGQRLTFAQNGSTRFAIEASTYEFTDAGTGGIYLLTERADPAAPAANTVKIYCKDNGANKTQVVALFATGAAVAMATQV
jgi:hypothetical protein